MSDDDLFTAPEVARFCKVDLKTIHNWVDRQQMEHFRTPGRHLRFRRADVIDFLRRFNYPVPEELQPRVPSILALVTDSSLAGTIKRVCGVDMNVEVVDSVMDLGLRSGHAAPDVIIMDAELPGLDQGSVTRALRAFPATSSCRVFLCSDSQPAPVDRAGTGVDGWIPRSSVRELRSTLDALLRS